MIPAARPLAVAVPLPAHVSLARLPLIRLPLAGLLLAGALLLASAGPASAATKPAPRTTLPSIERQVMCVTCKIPLNVAQSPQADRERAFIQGLIDQGESEAQIKHALVGQYGAAVLALPSTHGFDLAAYLVPLAVVLALIAMVLLLPPRWRRRARAAAATPQAAPPSRLSANDASRLESDLARFD